MGKESVDKNLKPTKTIRKEKDKGKHGWKVANMLYRKIHTLKLSVENFM